MFASLLAFAAVVASFAGVRALPEPSTPPTANAGADCTIDWTADPSGAWKQMHIELMTGDNLHMVHLTTVATVDGTDADKQSYTWPCPDVTMYSDVYFYQFSSPASKDYVWTTRWAIADKDGKTTTPPNPTQPDSTGKILDVPWGVGSLVDTSAATPAPTDVGSQAGGASSAAGSSAPGSTGAGASGSASASAGSASAPAGSASASTPVASGSGGATALPVSTGASASSGGSAASMPSGMSTKPSATAGSGHSSAGASGSVTGSGASPSPTGGAARDGISLVVLVAAAVAFLAL